MTNTNCLNCGKALSDKFCSGCGQKADTHRISFGNFLYHDVLHGTFHIDKGMLFTARQALTRPGQAALDYIAGKRKRYYNVFLLILITIGIMLFIRHLDQWFDSQAAEVITQREFPNEASRKLDEIITQKTFIFLFVPFAAFNSYILFRRKNLNLSEHFIISGMILLGILIIGTFGNVLFHLNRLIRLNDTFLSWLITAVILLYICFGYFNTFRGDYTRFGIIYRTLLFFGLIAFELVILFFLLFGYFSNWQYGEVLLTPFG